MTHASNSPELPGRAPAESVAVLTTTVLPADTNAYGNLFGGALMALIDKTASITASRHSRRNVVTASIDRVDFLLPVRLGDILTVTARLNWTGRTSMEIGVEAHAENRIDGHQVLACAALLTFVAIGDAGRPVPVPPVAPTSDEERATSRRASAAPRAGGRAATLPRPARRVV